jgi:hypothetical protein
MPRQQGTDVARGGCAAARLRPTIDRIHPTKSRFSVSLAQLDHTAGNTPRVCGTVGTLPH